MKLNIHLLVNVFMCNMVEVRGSHYLTQLSSHESTVIGRRVLNKKIIVNSLPKINRQERQETHGNINLWNTIL